MAKIYEFYTKDGTPCKFFDREKWWLDDIAVKRDCHLLTFKTSGGSVIKLDAYDLKIYRE